MQRSVYRNSGASFLFCVLDFYTLSLIFSLLRSIYPFSGCNRQKGFLLPKNHLYYIIARCPLSLLIAYRGFEIYFCSRNSQGFCYLLYKAFHTIWNDISLFKIMYKSLRLFLSKNSEKRRMEFSYNKFIIVKFDFPHQQ